MLFEHSIFLTEEDEVAVNHAGRRPARFAADEDDEVKKLRAEPSAPRAIDLSMRVAFLWFKLISLSGSFRS